MWALTGCIGSVYVVVDIKVVLAACVAQRRTTVTALLPSHHLIQNVQTLRSLLDFLSIC